MIVPESGRCSLNLLQYSRWSAEGISWIVVWWCPVVTRNSCLLIVPITSGLRFVPVMTEFLIGIGACIDLVQCIETTSEKDGLAITRSAPVALRFPNENVW